MSRCSSSVLRSVDDWRSSSWTLAATPRPEQSLGERLRAIRAQIVASGAPLLDEAALQAELADRRGER